VQQAFDPRNEILVGHVLPDGKTPDPVVERGNDHGAAKTE